MADILQFPTREPDDKWVMTVAIFTRAVDGVPFVMLKDAAAEEFHTDETTRDRGIRLADTVIRAGQTFRTAMERIGDD